ncbi:sigma factor G inhibitor Gin [Oceanobacillus damuensis]|uniref:sigma factor G inhibitor Gin n=1 Tax=Oceanobacillus damuensis TaxID=937928 RepID=UPI000A4831B0|nr:sigma factor G inhibitor Gin [Oceanobacillus damuensis]
MKNYIACNICKKQVDDGGVKNSQFFCHDCLDWITQLEEEINKAFYNSLKIESHS